MQILICKVVPESDRSWSSVSTNPLVANSSIAACASVAVNPEDPRYTSFKGKRAIVPICNRVIPIIEDTYVDLEFGTGCLKVTPAHDVNDKALGDKHKLDVIDIFNVSFSRFVD